MHRSPGYIRLFCDIDYLLSAPGVYLQEVRSSEIAECGAKQSVIGEIVVKDFGSSD